MTAKQLVNAIVERIEDDILGRKGIGDELDGVMVDDRREIRQTWRRIAAEEIAKWMKTP